MKLKYGSYFLAFIILAKILYLGVEVFYNAELINTITTKDVTQESLEYLEKLGHNISSVGFTLLLTPLLYLLYKKLFKSNIFLRKSSLFISMIGLFFGFHMLLTTLMDKIIDVNKEKRYSSYYISAFKYGMLSNNFGYESFIPRENFNHLNAADKVILSNIFLLNYIDESIITKLINNAQEQMVDVLLLKYNRNNYEKTQKNFEDKAKEIIDAYNSYIYNTAKLNKNFAKVDNITALNNQYSKFIDTLKSKYKTYEINVKEFEKSVKKNALEITNEKIDSHIDTTYVDLEKYFKYQGYGKAERQYKEKMNEEFGHYIKPNKWCKNQSCPSRSAIKKILHREKQKEIYSKVYSKVYHEAYKKFKRRSGGIPPDLNQRQFYKYSKVKQRAIRELGNKGLIVSNHFNYSKKQFAKAYKSKVNKEFKLAKKKFIKELRKQTAKPLTFGLTYNQFLYYFKYDFTKEYGKKDGMILYNMVKRKDTTNFYETFYKPKIKREHLGEYLLSKKDFQTNRYAQKGDNSIKHLYIPPFAIAMSLIAGVLNFVSVVSMLLVIMFKIDRFEPITQFILKNIMKIAILSLVVLYPFYEMKDSDILKEYKALEKIKEIEHGQEYLELLKWIIVYEKKILGD